MTMSQKQLSYMHWKLLTMYCLLVASNVLGQTNDLPAQDHHVNIEAGITTAMFYQVWSNPSSLLVIAYLCVFAWLLEDLPFVASKYVPHYTVILGMASYWGFAVEQSVPNGFPHPQMVFIANGCICGFIAFVIHRQVIARIVELVGKIKETKQQEKKG